MSEHFQNVDSFFITMSSNLFPRFHNTDDSNTCKNQKHRTSMEIGGKERYIECMNATSQMWENARDSEGMDKAPDEGRTSLKLRGLPFQAKVEDIVEWFGDHGFALNYRDVYLVPGRDSRPSGEAVVSVPSDMDSRSVQEAMHKQHMGSRYIEVYPDDDRGGRGKGGGKGKGKGGKDRGGDRGGNNFRQQRGGYNDYDDRRGGGGYGGGRDRYDDRRDGYGGGRDRGGRDSWDDRGRGGRDSWDDRGRGGYGPDRGRGGRSPARGGYGGRDGGSGGGSRFSPYDAKGKGKGKNGGSGESDAQQLAQAIKIVNEFAKKTGGDLASTLAAAASLQGVRSFSQV